MAQCLILKSFKGSQDGRHTVQFNEGDVADLSDYLMNCAVQTDFRRIDQTDTLVVENKAVITNKSREAESGRANVPARPFLAPKTK